SPSAWRRSGASRERQATCLGLTMAAGSCLGGIRVSILADCDPHSLLVQRRGRGRIPAAPFDAGLVSNAFCGRADLGFGAQQPASCIGGDGDRAGIRHAGGAGAGSGTVSGQGVVSAIGAFAVDSSWHYYRAFVAYAVQCDGNEAELDDDYLGTRNCVDLRGYNRGIRGLAEIGPGTGRGISRFGCELLADVLARHGAELEAADHWRGAADLYAFHGRDRGEFLSDRARQHAATGNLGAAAARHHTGNQRGIDHHLCVFFSGDCAVVPLAHARGRNGGRGLRNRGSCGGPCGMSANRRDFIKFVVAGAVTAGCPIDLSLVAAQTDTQKGHAADVNGEDNRICHQVRDGKVFPRPPASARHDVVIVGGGVSGLAAAYRLQHRDFLLLEKEPHWGGNAYEMEYESAVYATGSAFLTKDEYAYHFAKEIGLEPLPVDSSDASIIHGELVLDTWGEGVDRLPYPAPVRESFKKFKKEMLAIDVEKRGKEIFDQPFSDFLKGYPVELKRWWDSFGPSNWGATSGETAAGLAIETLQEMVEESRTDDRYTWPGGLGALTKRLVEILQPKYKDRMQTGATTVAVVAEKEEVQVSYMLGGELKTVAAKAVIMATPKFITRRIVEGLPEQQSDAMHQIRYIPYPVV